MKIDLSKLTTEELRELADSIIPTEINNRAKFRQKELWGNVITAMRKYEEECGDIIISDTNGRIYGIEFKDTTTPGELKFW